MRARYERDTQFAYFACMLSPHPRQPICSFIFSCLPLRGGPFQRQHFIGRSRQKMTARIPRLSVPDATKKTAVGQTAVRSVELLSRRALLAATKTGQQCRTHQ